MTRLRLKKSLFLATADGGIVGYLTGRVDSSRMPSDGERITRLMIEKRLILRPRTARFLARSLLDMAMAGHGRSASDFRDPRWPAHLHVRLVPEARGAGLGTALMTHWLDHLRRVESPGCHLQTLHENSGAVAFERMGFVRHGDPLLVPGLRGRRGERLHQQTMIWSP